VDKVLRIAEEELGCPVGSLALSDKLEDLFDDSLEWLEFIHRLREEVGPMTDEQATACETLEDLARVYDVSARTVG
jgi:hypothetical protein